MHKEMEYRNPIIADLVDDGPEILFEMTFSYLVFELKHLYFTDIVPYQESPEHICCYWTLTAKIPKVRFEFRST